MKTPLVNPKTSKNIKLKKLIDFYNETLGFCPNSIKTMYLRPEIAYSFIELNKLSVLLFDFLLKFLVKNLVTTKISYILQL